MIFVFYLSSQNILQPGTHVSLLVILASQKAEIRRIAVQSQPKQIIHFMRPYLEETLHKKGLVEWFKV
jgi:hypothetical protein